MNKSIITAFLTIVLSSILSLSAFADWKQVKGQWQYEKDGKLVMDRWITDGRESYYIGPGGDMKAGWMQLSGFWYFLNTIHDGSYGSALKGWSWIDGYCYFFDDSGKMLSDTIAPDGCQVLSSGAWGVQGKPQFIEDKGIITVRGDLTDLTFGKTADKPIGAVGSGGGSGGSSSGSSQRPQNTICSYSIQYVDLGTNTVIHAVAGQGKKLDSISIAYLELDDYEICDDQMTEFTLTEENQVVKVYYVKQNMSSPTDAEKVSWQLHFVEEGSTTKEILRSQRGISLEGSELIVDFPEELVKNGSYYRSLVESPYRVVLIGFGIQKFYIEFKKSLLPEEPKPDKPERERLNKWLEVSRVADEDLTGIVSMDGPLITETLAESNTRLKNLVSMGKDLKRHEVYLIAKNHTPSSFILGQYNNAGNISEMVMDHFQIEGCEYIVLKVGFEIFFEEEWCNHNFLITNDVESGCLTTGSETVRCRKCAYEVSIAIPAAGHQDTDQDDICEICYETVIGNNIPEAVHYEEGDMQARQIGKKVYLFRCIDEDYEDSLNNKQKAALFLCEQVIRSDIDSTSAHHKTIPFGSDNNYKSSAVRNWLRANAKDSLFAVHTGYIGISLAYTGATQKGSYEQLEDGELISRETPFQLLEDNIFLLSVEEALKYREYLWKFHDSSVNNPESQYSAYSRGYWLRTPQYTEANGDFLYSSGAYFVDLEEGNIHTGKVSDTSIGMRPAITILQQ